MREEQMTDEEIQAIAKFYEEPLTKSWAGAFEDYATKYPDTRHIHSPRSRASILHDHCVFHVQVFCANNPDITFPPKKRGLFTIELSGVPLGIDGAILARFKKLTERLLTSNISTAQVRKFNNQQPLEVQLDLFGFPLIDIEPPHINIGYLPDEFWTGLEAVYATMPNGSHALQWFIKLSDDKGASQTPIIHMPLTTSTPAQSRRVTPKRSADEKKKKGEDT
jgi:hypothetical protein